MFVLYFFPPSFHWSSPSHPSVKASEFMMKQELRWMQMSLRKWHSCPMLVYLLFSLTMVNWFSQFLSAKYMDLRLSYTSVVKNWQMVHVYFLSVLPSSHLGSQGNASSASQPVQTNAALALSSSTSSDDTIILDEECGPSRKWETVSCSRLFNFGE